MFQKAFSFLVTFIILFISMSASAAIVTKNINYSQNGVNLEGFLAYSDAKSTPQPGILIVHDWMGISDFTKDKAKQLAKEGFVAFAVDIYGKGNLPHNNNEAAAISGQLKNNRTLLRARIRAAYDVLSQMIEVDKKNIFVMGYCFGGTTALELARSGVPLAGIVSFHGGLSTPTPEDAKNIKGRVLILHGADDPNVPPAEVQAFKDEMKNAGVNMQFIAYKGAVHAFTNPKAGNDNSKGVAYNAAADKQSWIDFENFVKSVLKQ